MKRPKIVVILSVFYALVALVGLINSFRGRSLLITPLLGVLLASGLAVGLWRMQDWARRFVILLLSLGLVVGVCVAVAIYAPAVLHKQPVSIPGTLVILAVYAMVGFLIRSLMSPVIKQHFLPQHRRTAGQ